MKKLLLLLLAITFVSCQSDLDKKISIADYKATMEKIKKENKDYSDQDFNTAANEFAKFAFAGMATPTKELDITYKKLLDDAKKVNIEKKKAVDKYNAEMDKMRKLFYFNIEQVKYYNDADAVMYNDYYSVKFKVKNTSNEAITAIKGNVVIKNEKGETIFHSTPLERSGTLEVNENAESVENFIIFDTDNVLELKSLPLSKLKQYWYPDLIIYKSGKRVDAPKKPNGIEL